MESEEVLSFVEKNAIDKKIISEVGECATGIIKRNWNQCAIFSESTARNALAFELRRVFGYNTMMETTIPIVDYLPEPYLPVNIGFGRTDITFYSHAEQVYVILELKISGKVDVAIQQGKAYLYATERHYKEQFKHYLAIVVFFDMEKQIVRCYHVEKTW